MQSFNMWLEAKFSDADFAGETGPYQTYRIRYAYKHPKTLKLYQAWGFGSGTSPEDASKEFAEFIKDENGYKVVKILGAQRVPGKSATNAENTPKGLTNRTPTNQKVEPDKFKKL